MRNVDAKRKPHMVVGCSEQSKAYKLWDVSRNKIQVHRDVIVDEKWLFSSINGNSTNSGEWIITLGFETSSNVEIK